MMLLIAGLVLFLGVHSVRIVADDWRTAQIARMGELPWKAVYSIASLAGLALLVYGYGASRADPTILWHPPVWTKHLASLLTLAAFVLLAAAYVPRNHLKAKLHHPMVLGIKVWALAHLLANDRIGDMLLFGGFLVWATLSFRAARARDRSTGRTYPAGTVPGTVATVLAGVVAWAAFAMAGHAWLIGVRPFG
jgi:uncharacterized membrane protein